jgi:uncharacterized RDD family membrane protein YckC
LNTSAGQPGSASSWKEEVNRRIAAHQSREGLSTAKPATPEPSRQLASSRAAQAAARVAAHYAQVPSFSQMQAAEAEAAQHAAETDLPSSRAASEEPRPCEPGAAQAAVPVQPSAQDLEPSIVLAQPAAPFTPEAWDSEHSRLGPESNSTLLPAEPAPVHVPQQVKDFAPPAKDGLERAPLVEEPWDERAFEPVEPVQPIPANLIEFPRELVAPCKSRPRLAEGPLAAEVSQTPLSIFEVNPGDLSARPKAAGAAPASAWAESSWSDIELEDQTRDEAEPQTVPGPQLILPLAPMGRRLTAVLVDCVLIAGAFLASALVAVVNIGHSFPVKIMEISAVSALLLIGLLYQVLFLTLAKATPGMKCARISLCTFDGKSPTRAQLRRRLGALFLAVLPLGLGLAWVLFDEDRLCWHDRLSRTYLRKS